MNHRFWFYSAAFIIIVGLGTWYIAHRRQLAAELAAITLQGTERDMTQLERYVERQTEAAKLVGLAKLLGKNRPELVKPIVLKAYELNPNNRDIVILASHYSEAAKERLQFLDPLYQPNTK